jgi:hypothetical protein
MTTHNWLDGFGGLIRVVERDGADIVVKDVCFNDAVEQGAADETEFTINCCCGSTNIIPTSGGVVGKRWVSVLEVGDGNWELLVDVEIQLSKDTHTEPVVHPEVGGEVPDSHVGKSVGSAEHDENADRDSKTEITEEDEFGVLGFEKRTARVEVVDTCVTLPNRYIGQPKSCCPIE